MSNQPDLSPTKVTFPTTPERLSTESRFASDRLISILDSVPGDSGSPSSGSSRSTHPTQLTSHVASSTTHVDDDFHRKPLDAGSSRQYSPLKPAISPDAGRQRNTRGVEAKGPTSETMCCSLGSKKLTQFAMLIKTFKLKILEDVNRALQLKARRVSKIPPQEIGSKASPSPAPIPDLPAVRAAETRHSDQLQPTSLIPLPLSTSPGSKSTLNWSGEPPVPMPIGRLKQKRTRSVSLFAKAKSPGSSSESHLTNAQMAHQERLLEIKASASDRALKLAEFTSRELSGRYKLMTIWLPSAARGVNLLEVVRWKESRNEPIKAAFSSDSLPQSVQKMQIVGRSLSIAWAADNATIQAYIDARLQVKSREKSPDASLESASLRSPLHSSQEDLFSQSATSIPNQKQLIAHDKPSGPGADTLSKSTEVPWQKVLSHVGGSPSTSIRSLFTNTRVLHSKEQRRLTLDDGHGKSSGGFISDGSSRGVAQLNGSLQSRPTLELGHSAALTSSHSIRAPLSSDLKEGDILTSSHDGDNLPRFAGGIDAKKSRKARRENFRTFQPPEDTSITRNLSPYPSHYDDDVDGKFPQYQIRAGLLQASIKANADLGIVLEEISAKLLLLKPRRGTHLEDARAIFPKNIEDACSDSTTLFGLKPSRRYPPEDSEAKFWDQQIKIRDDVKLLRTWLKDSKHAMLQATSVELNAIAAITSQESLRQRFTEAKAKAEGVNSTMQYVENLQTDTSLRFHAAYTSAAQEYPEMHNIIFMAERYLPLRVKLIEALWRYGGPLLDFIGTYVAAPVLKTYGRRYMWPDLRDFVIIPYFRTDYGGGDPKDFKLTFPRRSLTHWFFALAFDLTLFVLAKLMWDMSNVVTWIAQHSMQSIHNRLVAITACIVFRGTSSLLVVGAVCAGTGAFGIIAAVLWWLMWYLTPVPGDDLRFSAIGWSTTSSLLALSVGAFAWWVTWSTPLWERR